jgi:hypothetical protein
MATLGITQAFGRCGASLRNPQWSVSAWAPDGALVVSVWAHHRQPSAPGTMEFADSMDRWQGPGNAEFRRNVTAAHTAKAPVRLVIATSENISHVQSGEDAGRIRKEYFVRDDLVGEVAVLE